MSWSEAIIYGIIAICVANIIKNIWHDKKGK